MSRPFPSFTPRSPQLVLSAVNQSANRFSAGQTPLSPTPPGDPLPWTAITVHISEIALKGRNRRKFLEALQRNLVSALNLRASAVRPRYERIDILPPSPAQVPALLQSAARVFGVASVSPSLLLPAELEALQKAAIEFYRSHAQQGASFAVRVQRSDKRFPLTSQELERRIGGAVKAQCAAPVNLEHPEVLIRFRIYADTAALEGPPLRGPGGLPVGTSSRVLVLLSGGIDSPVAAWLIMRRGCRVDFLHFHNLADASELRSSKLPHLVQTVTGPQGVRTRIFAIPYEVFQFMLLQHPVPPDLELILFRRFMARVAGHFARENGYAVLVTGDNLAQVASQTSENLLAFDDAAPVPVWRPLLAFNKEEIIDLAQKIETYDLSIQPYKDCCSIVARHPAVRPPLERIREAEQRLPLAESVARALEKIYRIDIGTRRLPHTDS